MNQSKQELRISLKQARYKLKDSERTIKSKEIVARLKALADWPKIKTIHYFEPIHEQLEVDISDLITGLEDTYPHIQMFAPRLINGDWHMVSISDNEPPENFDVIIVPMLGFDPQTLHRIGYGGGYYDKFLATQPDAQKIGVCFETGKTESMPTEPHDIALNIIVTEDNLYQL